MAKNTGESKRVPVKWIRDGAKAAYEKQSTCYICGTSIDLELHHTHGLTNLLEKWAKEKGYSLDSDEEVLSIRDEFISTHHKEIYEEVYTLCNSHHIALHRIYGKSPALHTASKQGIWIENQKRKLDGLEPIKLDTQGESSTGRDSKKSWFGSFL